MQFRREGMSSTFYNADLFELICCNGYIMNIKETVANRLCPILLVL